MTVMEPVTVFNADGTIYSKYFVDQKGRKTGILTKYFHSGKVREVSNYKEDVLDGSSISYFENGKLRGVTNFSNGLLKGFCRIYHESGEIFFEREFDNAWIDNAWIF